MRESRHLGQIARLFHQPISKVRQTLRALREAGMLPGKRGGDLRPHHIADVVFGLCAEGIQASPRCVRELRLARLQDAADLPATAGEMLRAVIETLPKSPVLGDLDLDDGFLSVSDESVVIECLSLSGKRAVVRYGTPDETTSPTYQFKLNEIRELAEIVEAFNNENRKTQTHRAA